MVELLRSAEPQSHLSAEAFVDFCDTLRAECILHKNQHGLSNAQLALYLEANIFTSPIWQAACVSFEQSHPDLCQLISNIFERAWPKKEICIDGCRIVFGLFFIVYNRAALFEAVCVDYVQQPAEFLKLGNNAIPVYTMRRTAGLVNVVALFPENWLSTSSCSHGALYFMDVFQRRFDEITRTIIRSSCDDSVFPTIRVASDRDVSEALVAWVTLHEHFHEFGALPFSQNTKLKGSRNAAAIEELRVDLLAMNHLKTMIEDSANSLALKAKYSLWLETILAERLLRYPVQYSPNGNFDAISSQILFNYLQSKQKIKVVNDKLKIDPSYVSELNELLSMIFTAELRSQVEKSRIPLEVFSKEWGGFSEKNGEYEHIRYFQLQHQVQLRQAT